jgi:hypothetical protein
VNKFLKVLMAMSLLLVVSCSNEDIPADEPVNGRTEVANPPKVNVRVAPPPPAPVEVVTPVLPGPVLPPPVVPVPPVIPILGGDERHGGNSDDDNSCNDQDSDGVCDDRDKCADFDDAIDPDGDGSPGQLVADLVQGCDCEPENALVGIGDLCSSTTECAISTCDAQGSGECIVENAPFGADCGNPGEGECDADDQCDGQGNCVAEVAPNGSACGNAPFAICDAVDTCVNGECIDNVQPVDTPCRPVAVGDVCDVAEVCDGVLITCPDNEFVALGTICRESASECDRAETCNGGAASCPPDLFLPDGSNCGEAPQGVCDFQDQCEAGICENKFASADYVCNPAADEECDVAENCTGVEGDVDCPADFVLPVGTVCGGPGSDQFFCSDLAFCTGGGFCVGGITLPDGFDTDEPCNVNNGELRCEGTIFCENGFDVCSNFNGSPIECTEQIVLDPNDLPPLDVAIAAPGPSLFGYSVAMDNGWAAVGNSGTSETVQIYRFDVPSDTWVLNQTLTGPCFPDVDPSVCRQGFGTDIDMSGNLLIIGTLDPTGGQGGGYQILRRSGSGTYFSEKQIKNSSSTRYGSSVSIYDGGSKQYAMAGDPVNSVVAFLIFNYEGDNDWDQRPPISGTGGFLLGTDVKVRGDAAFATQPNGTLGSTLAVGYVTSYHRGSGTTADFTFSYNATGSTANELLGNTNDSLTFNGDTGIFAVGNHQAGVRVFLDNVTTFVALDVISGAADVSATVPASNDFSYRFFGEGLGINGNTLLIGDSSAASGAGRFHIYVTADNLNWTYQETVSPSVAATNQRFGFSVEADSTRAIIGAPAGLGLVPSGGSKGYFYGLIP